MAVSTGLLAAPEAAAAAPEHSPGVLGPGAVPITLQINGKAHSLKLEPRVTLLDALRNQLDLTGAKKVCDRGVCGACTVIMDGRPVYACNVLAIEAEGHRIETIEGIGNGEQSPPGDGGIRQARRATVRILHAGLCGGLQGLPGQASQSDDGRCGAWPGRQPLPLRHLRRGSRSRSGSSQNPEGRTRQWISANMIGRRPVNAA